VCLIALALLVAKLLPEVPALDRYWYAGVFAVTWAWLLMRLFRKPPEE